MPSSTKIRPDPLLPAETATDPDPDRDFASHVRTYNRFTHMLGWFAFHVLVILAALYFAVIRDNGAMAIALVVAGLAVFAFGALRQRPVRYDLNDRAEQHDGTLAPH